MTECKISIETAHHWSVALVHDDVGAAESRALADNGGHSMGLSATIMGWPFLGDSCRVRWFVCTSEGVRTLCVGSLAG